MATNLGLFLTGVIHQGTKTTMTPEEIFASFLVNIASSSIFELKEQLSKARSVKNSEKIAALEAQIEALESRKSSAEHASKAIATKLRNLPASNIREALSSQPLINSLAEQVANGDLSKESIALLIEQTEGLDPSDVERVANILLESISMHQPIANAVVMQQGVDLKESVSEIKAKLDGIQGSLNNNSVLEVSSNEELNRFRELSKSLRVNHFESAEQFFENEKFEEAIEALNSCIELVESDQSNEAIEFKIKCYLKLAVASFRNEDSKSYLKYSGLAIDLGATDEQVEATETFYLYFSGNKEKAAAKYQKLFDQYNKTQYFENYATICIELKQFDEIKSFIKTIDEEHYSSNYWGIKSIINETEGLHRDAIDCAKKSIEIKPECHKAKLNFSYRVCSLVEKSKFSNFFENTEFKDLLDQAFEYFNEFFACVSKKELTERDSIDLSNIIAYSCLTKRRSNVSHIAEFITKHVHSEDTIQNLLHYFNLEGGDDQRCLEIVTRFRKYNDSDTVEFYEFNLRSILQQHSEVIDHYFANKERLKSNSRWHALVANSYVDQFKSDKAITFLEDLANEYPSASADIAFVYSRIGEPDKAFLYFTSYLEHHPDDRLVRAMHAKNEMLRKCWSSAHEHFEKSGHFHYASSFIEDVVICLYNDQSYEKCIKVIDEIVTLGSPSTTVYEIQATLFYENSYIKDCLEAIKNLRRLTQSRRSLVELQAYCLMRLNDFETAEAVIDAALLDSDDIGLQIFRLRCFLAAKKVNQALEEGIKLIQKNPSKIEAREFLFGLSAIYLNHDIQLDKETEEFLRDNTRIVCEKSNSVEPIKIANKPNGDPNLKPILKRIRKRKRSLENIKRMCERKTLPYTILAYNAGCSKFETYASLRLNICSNLGNVNIFESCVNADKNGVVLDISSIVTISQLGFSETLKKSKLKFFVHQNSLDEITELYRSYLIEKQSANIQAVDHGKFTLIEYSEDDKLRAAEELLLTIDFLCSSSVVLSGSGLYPALAKSDVANDFFKVDRELPHVFPSIRLSLETGATLVSDDPNIRAFASTLGVKVMGTTNLYRSFSSSIVPVSEEQSYDLSSKLMRLGYPCVGLNASELQVMLSCKEEQLLKTFERDIQNGDYSISSSMKVISATFLNILINDPLNFEQLRWLYEISRNHKTNPNDSLIQFVGFLAASCIENIDYFKKAIQWFVDNLDGDSRYLTLFCCRITASSVERLIIKDNPFLGNLWRNLYRAEVLLSHIHPKYK